MGQETKGIELCIDSFYSLLSGETGVERDWARFRDLFVDHAILSICRRDDAGRPDVSTFTVDEYIERLRAFLAKKDFYERATGNEIHLYGDIGCVFNEYEACADREGRGFLKRGKNIVSLALNGEDWKITSMLWEDGV